MKQITIYNTLKGRLETVRFEFTPENTTWFDDSETFDIYRIADGFDGLLIQETGYTYPILIGDVSRANIGNAEQKASELLREQDSRGPEWEGLPVATLPPAPPIPKNSVALFKRNSLMQTGVF